MQVEKKARFWIVTVDGKEVSRSRVRPSATALEACIVAGNVMTVDSISEEEADAEKSKVSKIKEILESLDPTNDDHWTQRGLPALTYIEEVLGDRSITRRDIKAVAPSLRRGSANAED